jgi:hypothetical protein
MNIQILLQEIANSGMTDAQIGDQLNLPQPTITRLRNGTHKSTSYERGTQIFALHKRVVKRSSKPKEAA